MTEVLPGPLYISCPYCHAPSGDRCRDQLSGFVMPIDYHGMRKEAAKSAIPYPNDLALRTMFPSVDEFAQLMRRELWANRRKGDRSSWRKVSTWVLWVEVSYHSAKLAIAVKTNDKAKIQELTADTANMLMMLADSAGLLDD